MRTTYDSGAFPLTLFRLPRHREDPERWAQRCQKTSSLGVELAFIEWQLECVPRKRGSVLIELDGLFVFVGELSFCLTIETSSGTDLLFHVHHEFGALAQEVLGILAALT